MTITAGIMAMSTRDVPKMVMSTMSSIREVLLATSTREVPLAAQSQAPTLSQKVIMTMTSGIMVLSTRDVPQMTTSTKSRTRKVPLARKRPTGRRICSPEMSNITLATPMTATKATKETSLNHMSSYG